MAGARPYPRRQPWTRTRRGRGGTCLPLSGCGTVPGRHTQGSLSRAPTSRGTPLPQQHNTAVADARRLPPYPYPEGDRGSWALL